MSFTSRWSNVKGDTIPAPRGKYAPIKKAMLAIHKGENAKKFYVVTCENATQANTMAVTLYNYRKTRKLNVTISRSENTLTISK